MSAPKKNPPRLLEVLTVERKSPHLVRVALGGDALRGFGPAWPAAHIKLMFPRGQQREPKLPTLDADGSPVWPAPAERPIVRTYSVREHRADALIVDFVVHEPAGPASDWALHAKPGMRVGLAGPGGPLPMLPRADWYLLTGDLSALPAIGALLEALPQQALGRVFIQLADARDKQALEAPAGVHITWLFTDGRVTPSTDLVQTVLHASWPAGTPQIWLAGENSQVVTLRDSLLARFPASRATMYAVPYWKQRQTEEEYHLERHRVMDELAAE